MLKSKLRLKSSKTVTKNYNSKLNLNKKGSSIQHTIKGITKLNNDISQNNTKISGFQQQITDLESEIQTLTDQLANRNTEHEKLTELEKI